MTANNDYSIYLQEVIDISRQAADKIIEIYNSGFSVEKKDDRTPLTEADLAAHNTIVAGLTKMTPDIPVLSEESAKISFEERSSWQRYWLVDPLDGTREFIKRNGEFTVNIALIENGESVLGVIVVPVTGLTYSACRDQGAYRQEPGQQPSKMLVRSVDPQQKIIAGSRSHGSERMQQFLAKVGPHELISMGSSLKSCLVAEGKADIYARLGLTSEWDTAAAQCVVEEAGGQLTRLDMSPLRYNTKDSLLNPDFLVFGDADFPWQDYLPEEESD